MRTKSSTSRSDRLRPLRRLAIEPLEDRRMLSGSAGGAFHDADLLAAGAMAAIAQEQQVSTSPASLMVTPGQTFSLDVNYTTSPANPTLLGFGVRMHYNSSRVYFEQLTSVLQNGLISQQSPAADTANSDGDTSTDMYVSVSWASTSGQWPGSLPMRLFTVEFTAASAAGPGATYVRFSEGALAPGWTFSSTPATIQFPAHVVGRHVFYNRSSFDGNDSGANVADDSAIAPDKSALLAGQQAAFQNYTSYSRGINGVMIDFDELPGTPLLSDFQLRVGNSSTTSNWTNPSAAPTITVRNNVGTGQVDRLTLVWPDGAILGKWLQISVLATPRTGLASADLFYFGNSPGESGGSPSNAAIEGEDYVGTRAAAQAFAGSATITNRFDYNRDSVVDSNDTSIVRSYMGHLGWSLKLITPAGSAASSTAAAAIESVTPSADTFAAAGVATTGDSLEPASVPVQRIDSPVIDPEPAPPASTAAEESAPAARDVRLVAARAQRETVDLFADPFEDPTDDLAALDAVFQNWSPAGAAS